ncbi:primosomal protein N' family DNA-binding protein [Nocardioides sambongensis]|uniref:primosomal protein N' family DNA-binding protein n=1 Tax=Nocardioides sambongensis TaxID=2589074 RepID=UPI001E594FC4|nr:hypothetical protein [Nocardioides sambongensis]
MRPADEPALELPGLVRDRAAEGRAKAARTRARNLAEAEIVERDPVVGVLLDLAPAHLDREFDYAVPAAMSDGVAPGVRVKVRFAGQDVDGFVVRRGDSTRHDGALAPVRRLVSAEPVLTESVRDLCDRVAARYAGTSADVRRLAIPPRHAGVEKEPSPPEPPLRSDQGCSSRGRRTRPRTPSGAMSPRAKRRAGCGRLRPGRTGPPCWPPPPRTRWPPAGAASCACPTTVT